MSLARFLRILAERRRQSKSLKLRKSLRLIRAEAAKRGQRTEVMNRAAQARVLFGDMA